MTRFGKVLAVILTVILIGGSVGLAGAFGVASTPGPISTQPTVRPVVLSTPLPGVIILTGTGPFIANTFYFLKVNGRSGAGSTVPLTAEFGALSFLIAPNNAGLCSFWFASGYADPVNALYGVDFHSFLYAGNGRSGGTDRIELNPRTPGRGGVWIMSTCDSQIRITVDGWQ